MAARHPQKHTPAQRAKIEETKLINRLTKHVLTYPSSRNFKRESLSPSQVSAALGLLRKSLPDLAAMQVETQTATKITVSWKK